MGFVYCKLDQFTESLEFFRDALIGEKKALEPEHTSTLPTILWRHWQEKAMRPDSEEVRNAQNLIEQTHESISQNTGIECDPQFPVPTK
ncbi:hypothetical protein N7536_011396 [Penicillium majusculum]|nr:hypothetical protein N7536_011396 [Penicillium majusculum]